MLTIHEVYSESHSRPADRPWTAEENASFARNRAETVRLAQERLAAKPVKTFYLASPDRIVSFFVDTVKQEVEVASRYRLGRRTPVDPEVMSIKAARERWIDLIQAGYVRW